MNHKTLLYLIGLVFLLSNCKDKDTVLIKPKVLTFDLKEVSIISQNIDETKQIIEVVLPYQASLKDLIPTISISDGASIVPSSGVAQDFSKPIYYTLTSKNGVKTIYTVMVKTEDQPQPQIVKLGSSELEAGETFSVKGSYFGKFALDIKTYLVDSLQKEYAVKNTYKDSSEIVVEIPFEQNPSKYQVKVQVKQKSIVSKEFVRVRYPSPQIQQLLTNNVLQGDTLKLSGLYIDATKYNFEIELSDVNGKSTVLPAKQNKVGELYSIISTGVAPNSYTIKVLNKSEVKTSKVFTNKVVIYDAQKPFVTGIVDEKPSYKAGDVLVFKAVNFDKVNARFYQVQLSGTASNYFINGQYDATKKNLNVNLPTNINTGNYTINCFLTDSNGGILYNFKIDQTLNIK